MRIENNDLIIPTYDYDKENPNKNYGHDPDFRDYREYSCMENIVEASTLCYYDIRLFSRTTVETCCLLERLRNAKDQDLRRKNEILYR